MRKRLKFKVVNEETGEEIENCFVLFPEHDKAAVAALEEYAKNTVNSGMANVLQNWATRIQQREDDPSVKQYQFRCSR